MNYITGTILSERQLHSAEVVGLIFDEENSCLITAGGDGKICVIEDKDGALCDLRCIENTHKDSTHNDSLNAAPGKNNPAAPGSIACIAYSRKLSVVVSGGHKDGEFKVWGFQRLDLKGVGVSTFKDVTAISIIDEYGLIVVSGDNGCCHVWKYDFVGREEPILTCLCRLGSVSLDTHAVTGLSRLMGTNAKETKEKEEEKKKKDETRATRSTRKTFTKSEHQNLYEMEEDESEEVSCASRVLAVCCSRAVPRVLTPLARRVTWFAPTTRGGCTCSTWIRCLTGSEWRAS